MEIINNKQTDIDFINGFSDNELVDIIKLMLKNTSNNSDYLEIFEHPITIERMDNIIHVNFIEDSHSTFQFQLKDFSCVKVNKYKNVSPMDCPAIYYYDDYIDTILQLCDKNKNNEYKLAFANYLLSEEEGLKKEKADKENEVSVKTILYNKMKPIVENFHKYYRYTGISQNDKYIDKLVNYHNENIVKFDNLYKKVEDKYPSSLTLIQNFLKASEKYVQAERLQNKYTDSYLSSIDAALSKCKPLQFDFERYEKDFECLNQLSQKYFGVTLKNLPKFITSLKNGMSGDGMTGDGMS